MRKSVRRAVPAVLIAGVALTFGTTAQAGHAPSARQCQKALTGKIGDDDFAAATTADTRVEFYDRVEHPAPGVVAVGVLVSIRQEPMPGFSYWRSYPDLGFCKGRGAGLLDEIGQVP